MLTRSILFAGLAVSASIALSACAPSTEGEFATAGKPTKTRAEKIALVSGIPSPGLLTYHYNPVAENYSLAYDSEVVSRAAVKAAAPRMCRYRKLQFEEFHDGIWRVQFPSLNIPANPNIKTATVQCR